jgi:hypothetical protein
MIERDHSLSGDGGAAPPGTVRNTRRSSMLTRSKHWLADRLPVRSKHWFAVATVWLIAAAVVLSPDGWHWR